jgi:hypothetical protein
MTKLIEMVALFALSTAATAAENRLSFRRNPHTSFCGSQRLPNNRD